MILPRHDALGILTLMQRPHQSSEGQVNRVKRDSAPPMMCIACNTQHTVACIHTGIPSHMALVIEGLLLL